MTGYGIEGKAKEACGFIHLINSGAASLDGSGRAKDAEGKGVINPWKGNIDEKDYEQPVRQEKE